MSTTSPQLWPTLEAMNLPNMNRYEYPSVCSGADFERPKIMPHFQRDTHIHTDSCIPTTNTVHDGSIGIYKETSPKENTGWFR